MLLVRARVRLCISNMGEFTNLLMGYNSHNNTKFCITNFLIALKFLNFLRENYEFSSFPSMDVS